MSSMFRLVKTNRLLSLVVTTYLVVLIVAPSKGLEAVRVSAMTFAGVALIILAVFILIGLFQVWARQEAVVRHLGRDSGAKGLLLGALLGTALNGPLFSVFPLIKSLLDKGAKVGVIAVIFATYAIKVPMIPLEIALLGPKFTFVHNALMFVSAFLMAPLMEGMMGRSVVEETADEASAA